MFRDPPASRRWLGLGVLGLVAFITSTDAFVLLLALPAITRDLGAGAVEQLWITDVYGFVLVGFMLAAGGLGDRIGRRRVLLAGAALFAIASTAAAVAPTPLALIVARAVLGLAGATLAPTSLGLLSTLFADRRERRFAVVVWQMCFMGGALVGPVLGGLLLIGGWWGAVFLLGVPAMTLLVATAPFTVPESRDAAAGRVDLASVALSLAAVLPIVHGAKLLADGGGSALAIALIVGGLVVGLVFVRRQLRLADPLLDVRMFRRPAFAAIVGIMVLVTTISALLFVVAQYLQLVAGLTAVEAALAMAPASVTAIVAIGLAPRAARRWGSMPVIVAGMAIAAAGALTLGLSAAAPGVAAGLAVATFGNTSVVALGTVLVLEAFPDRRSATAGAIAETGTELGFALGIAGLGSLVTAVYRGAVVLPPGTAAAMAEAARDSLGGAVATGDPAIVRAAVVAYTAALPAIGVVVAGVAATIAVLALIFVRSPAKPLTSSESTANLD